MTSFFQCMQRTIHLILILQIMLMFAGQSLNANENIINQADTSSKQILRVYIDYAESDNTERFLRSQIPFVSYVRDPHLAEVHVLITDQSTGSGGKRFKIAFIGREKLKDFQQSLFYVSAQSDTEDQWRHGLSRMVQLGLMPFVSQTEVADQIAIHYDEKKIKSAVEHLADDWDFWVFNIQFGGGLRAEESRNAYNVSATLGADRITETWRFNNLFEYVYEEEKFEDDGETLISSLREWQNECKLVRSLDDHWSTGLSAEINATTYKNIKLGWILTPAIEYNIFPWPEAEQRKFTIAYLAGFQSAIYKEETLFNKLRDDLWLHALDIELQMNQTWGKVDLDFEAFQYLEKTDKYSIELEVEFALRIASGWEFVMESTIESIHDQIYLPRGDASIEEILLRRRQLATTYEVDVTFGFRYTFGSIYNNIINRRL